MRNRFPTDRPRATITDVATLAGVSKTTVSKFLSPNTYYIAADTARRIEDAIRSLEFQPNAMAQGLSSRRSHTIGVVVASVVNPFYPELIAGVEEIIGAAGYTLLLGSTEGKAATETAVVRSMMQRQVDGVVMASVTMRDREVERLASSGLDVVLASRALSRNLVDTVTVDNRLGAQHAAQHLIAHGHQRIAHIAGPQNTVPFRQRLQGYRDALVTAGLPVHDALVVTAPDTRTEAGAAAMEALLALPNPPTAVFVANDTRAIGVLEACDLRGLSIPDDLAVVGFDNIWVAGVPGVSLTTVDGKARQIGRTAANLLAQRIGDRTAKLPPRAADQVTLKTDVVVRRSCGCSSDKIDGADVDDSVFPPDRKPVPYRAAAQVSVRSTQSIPA